MRGSFILMAIEYLADRNAVIFSTQNSSVEN